MAKDCLYCGLQFSDTTRFCPHCGRPTESGFTIRLLQEVELVRLRGERKEKDDLIRQLVLSLRFKSPAAQVHHRVCALSQPEQPTTSSILAQVPSSCTPCMRRRNMRLAPFIGPKLKPTLPSMHNDSCSCSTT